MEQSEWAGIIGPVARELLGNPTAATKTELRYGSRGSLSIDLAKGTWFDFETNEGGGVTDLIARTGEDPATWLTARGWDLPEEERRERRDVRPNGGGGKVVPLRRVDRTFDYVDVDGTLLFQVVRYEPKDFRQRRPDRARADGWNWSTRGVKQVPYRLPELDEAISNGRPIYIVEGEKCVDYLRSLGLAATCNAGGAGKWSDDLARYFDDTCDVVIIPDFDPQKRNPKTGELMFHPEGQPVLPGQDHALDVAAKLAPVCRSVRILDLGRIWPTVQAKNDIYDWFQIGGNTVEVFNQLVDQCALEWSLDLTLEWPGSRPPPLTTAAYLLPDPGSIPQRQWLYGYHYMRGIVTATVAPGGFGKTTLSLYEILTMVTKLGLRVWYVSGEDDRVEIDRRIAAHVQKYELEREQFGNRLFIDDKMTFPLKIAKTTRNGIVFDDAALALFERTIQELAVDVVILDPFISFHLLPENDTTSMDTLLKLLSQIATRRNCCIELSHHVRKPGFGQVELTVYDARGAAAIVNAVRSCRVLNQMSLVESQQMGTIKPEERSSYIRIDSGKRNMAPPEAARWKHIVSIDIANGDRVQAIEDFEFRPVRATSDDEVWVVNTLRERRYRTDTRSPDWFGVRVAAYFNRGSQSPGDRKWIRQQIDLWLAPDPPRRPRPLIRVVQRDDENRKPKSFYELVPESIVVEGNNGEDGSEPPMGIDD
jgi:hypothetical protein